MEKEEVDDKKANQLGGNDKNDKNDKNAQEEMYMEESAKDEVVQE